ncbi:MAG: Phosphate transport regulator (distant homolog of PhoU) [uncultured Solirubrobacterales bacterium]|uniref:Phosphate transport regulator (Distant homolog of PhoU) n=1 Tax=uncultured Solirubrobacterales bacterium TaxID=768556 RepID=A0A6J4SVJ8_9ACTN|nr:MAG: Phosphate transport regulator (distant homolog of PhoU) [uncultured Solirubrobacterales bacterium]
MGLFGRAAGNDPGFFRLFAAAGSNALRAAELLERLMRSWPEDDGLGREILIAEQDGDRITHDLIHLLNTSRGRPPIDREDVHGLATALDDVVDLTEEVADFMALYGIEAPMSQAEQLAGILHAACRSLAEALGRLDDVGSLNPYLVEVNRLENEGDRIVREALASLFAGGIDPILIIRWKDVFERLEEAIDACETVAHILEGIAVKHA